MKRWIAIWLTAATVLCMGSGCAAGKGVTVCDASGEVIATPRSTKTVAGTLRDGTYESYVTYALEEAIAVLAAATDGDTGAAQKALFRGDYTVHTLLDPAVHAAAQETYAAYEGENLPFGCAVLDYSGAVAAIYSGGEELFALKSHSPCSAIKPLSVYAPAVEFGVADWGTQWKDAPYKKVTDLAGNVSLWPTNARGDYTNEPTSMYECVQQSLNTAAVHCLKKVGVQKSLSFLTDRLGINVAYEQNKAVLEGEDEVIGNVAMGFLYNGFTPLQLAGYFQIFGNHGVYAVPHCVDKICDADGNVVYAFAAKQTQVIEDDTAYILNRLLQSVVLPGGTAKAARVDGTEVVGKTGTSDEDNWFVGLTPDYCCAIWHGNREDGRNAAPQLFTNVFAKMPSPKMAQFAVPDSVERAVCCMDSGLRASALCRNVQVGYYAASRLPTTCDVH